MPEPVVKVEGARELRRTLAAAGHDLADMTAANAEVAALVAGYGSRSAPRRSGRLAGSHRGNKSKTQAVVRAGGASVPYANAIHWGVGARAGLRGPHNIAPRPWLWQAANDHRPEVIDLYWQRVEAAVKSIHGTTQAG